MNTKWENFQPFITTINDLPIEIILKDLDGLTEEEAKKVFISNILYNSEQEQILGIEEPKIYVNIEKIKKYWKVNIDLVK